jgi:hypothetical protein
MEEEYRGFKIKYHEGDKEFAIEGDDYSARTLDLDVLRKKINQILAKEVAGIKVLFGYGREELKKGTLTSIDEFGKFWIKKDEKDEYSSSDRSKENVVWLDNENNGKILERIKEVQEREKELQNQEKELWASLEKPSIKLREPESNGTEGQDRKSYTDTQDRDSYVTDSKLKTDRAY